MNKKFCGRTIESSHMTLNDSVLEIFHNFAIKKAARKIKNFFRYIATDRFCDVATDWVDSQQPVNA